MKEPLKEAYNFFLGNESLHPALKGKIELALEDAWIQGHLGDGRGRPYETPNERIGWVNLFMNPQDGKLICGSEVFELHREAVQNKSENEGFIYVTTVMIKWEEKE
jgi:hypothetical protein